MGHVQLWRVSWGSSKFPASIPSQSSKIQILTLFCLPLYSHFSTPSLIFILFQLPQFLFLLLFCFVFGCSSNKMTLLLSKAFVFFTCSTGNIWLYTLRAKSTQMSRQRDHSRVKVLPSISNTSLLSRFLFPSKHINTLSATYLHVLCVCVRVCVCVFPEEI